MTKRTEESEETPPELAKPVAPAQTPAFDRSQQLQARFDAFANSPLSQFAKEMGETRRHLSSVLNFSKEMQETQRRLSSVINSPLSQFAKEMGETRRHLSSVLNFSKEMQETRRHLSSPLSQFAKEMGETRRHLSSVVNSPLSQFSKEMADTRRRLSSVVNSPLSQFSKEMADTRRHLSSVLNFSKEMEETRRHLSSVFNPPLFESLKRFRAQFDSPAFAAMQAAKTWADTVSESDRAVRLSVQETLKAFHRAAQEAAAMARVDVSELAIAVDASLGPLTLRAGAAEGAAPTSTVPAPEPTSIESILKSLPLPVLVFLLILWHLFLEPLDHAYVEQWVNSTPEARPQIIGSANENLGEDYSHKLRCVRGAGINVREGPSKTAPIIGRLGRSQAIAVIETEGSFSRIQYFDAGSGEIREGWAASSYLVGAAC